MLVSRPSFAAIVALAGAALAQDPASTGPSPTDDLEFFERQVRPLFAEHCVRCHGQDKQESGLRLDHREGWMRGGDRGPALVPGDVEHSRLVHAVRYRDPEFQMPPDGRLPDAAILVLEEWVRRGAPDPRDAPSATLAHGAVDIEAARRHWAFAPVSDAIEAPPVAGGSWPLDDLDRFVLARLERAGLTPAPDADQRSWLRRVTLDLTGLPPAPDDIERFVQDVEPAAFERVVDRLLASPQYAERQARAWLDLSRYADSNGLDENLALANAWRYRDAVVRAFDRDQPYDEFVRWQVAGDLVPSLGDPALDRDRLALTGFLALGPKMLAEQDKEKLVMDVVDEQIDVLTKAVLGLTVSCARCHDHKFDPISQRDYYALAGILKSTSCFENLDHVSRWRELDLSTPAERAARETWQAESRHVDAALAKASAEATHRVDDALRDRRGAHLLAGLAAAKRAVWFEAESFARGNLIVDTTNWGTPALPIVRTGSGGAQHAEWDFETPHAGRQALHVRFAAKESRPVRLLVDGRVIAERALEETTGDWFGKDQRWHVVAELDLAQGAHVLRLERGESIPHLDRFALVPAGGEPWPCDPVGDESLVPGLVRAAADHFASARGAGDAVLAPLFADPESGEFVARLAANDAFQTREAPLETDWPPAMREGVAALRAERAQLDARKPPEVPTAPGVSDGAPVDVAIHVRGNHRTLRSETTPRGALAILDRSLPQPAIASGSGRLELAQWLVDPRNPLTARVIVNRVWQGHFGRGLAAQPSNFGLRGEAPTHPELLDALARDFVDGGWSLKRLHRRIVLSRTYRQSSLASGAGAALAGERDPENLLLARYPRRRLEAEAIRDAMLFASGRLDLTLGGTQLGTKNRDYVTNDQSGNGARYDAPRRTLYLPVIRNALSDVLSLFDYGDPSMSNDARPRTAVATQALWLMNSPFVGEISLAFARRLLVEEPHDLRARIDRAHRIALARPATDGEIDRALRWLARTGDEQALVLFCQALLCCNEFLDLA
ncbi:MAG: DUF1553 domain-containing protein [Planctomycetes bacterium]|nr:DUF1553 domain-containing protein [Planctomycetota bacterium]